MAFFERGKLEAGLDWGNQVTQGMPGIRLALASGHFCFCLFPGCRKVNCSVPQGTHATMLCLATALRSRASQLQTEASQDSTRPNESFPFTSLTSSFSSQWQEMLTQFQTNFTFDLEIVHLFFHTTVNFYHIYLFRQFLVVLIFKLIYIIFITVGFQF